MAYMGVEATIPLGQLGLMTDMTPSELPPGALIEAKNIVFNKGTLEKAPGSLVYNPNYQLDGAVVALHDWWPNTTFQRMIALTNSGKIYRDIGDRTFTLATPINTGFANATPNSMFVDGGNETAGRDKKLFMFTDGAYQLQVLSGDGTEFAEISSPAADWTSNNYPRLGLVHRNRLWAFQGQRAYASNTGDHENFTSGILTQSIFPGEGGDIIGAFVYKGRMVAFKEGNFVYFLNETDPSSDNWYWQKLASNFGLAAPNGIAEVLDDLFVGNSTGTVTSYKAADTLGDLESGDVFRIAKMERYHRANSHPSGIRQLHALYDEELKQAYFTTRNGYRTENDRLVNIDVNNPSPRISYLDKGTPVSLMMRRDRKSNIPGPFYGDSTGFIHQMNYEDRLEGSSSYMGRFQTAYTDFRYVDGSLMNRQKHFDWLTVEYVPEGNHPLSIEVFIDGKYISTKTVTMQAQGVYLDTFLLSTDRLAQYTTQSGRIPLTGTGKRISFRCSNNGANQSFQIASLTVGFRAGSNDNPRF